MYRHKRRTKRIGGEIISDEICLEKRAHLRVAGSRAIEDKEMHLEGGHENQDGQHNETANSRRPMLGLLALENTRLAWNSTNHWEAP